MNWNKETQIFIVYLKFYHHIIDNFFSSYKTRSEIISNIIHILESVIEQHYILPGIKTQKTYTA